MPSTDALSLTEIQARAQAAPGSVWYIVGEPNRIAGMNAASIVPALHDIYQAIRAADPTAKITSPSILNWEFTCYGCGGYQQGKAWVEEFRATWLSLYGQEPQVDIWAIDLFPIDWTRLPTTRTQEVLNDLQAMRLYLNSIPAHAAKPIWIVELGLHWGWSEMQYGVAGCEGKPTPAGTYRAEDVKNYFQTMFRWLVQNRTALRIEKWFILSTYYDITKCNYGSYAGLTLFNGPEASSGLTDVGQFVQDWAAGLRN